MRRSRSRALLAAFVLLGACDVPFARFPAAPPPGTGGLAGFVRTADGQPVPGAFVAASCLVADGRLDLAQPEMTTGEDGWYDLGAVGLQPGPCALKGGTSDGLVFFVENVTVLPGQSLRLDLTATRG